LAGRALLAQLRAAATVKELESRGLEQP
jgi:hypothetical protein